MAICGRECSFASSNLSGVVSFEYTWNMEGIETETIQFGSGVYGDYLVCGINGTVQASFYDMTVISDAAIGDIGTVTMTIGYSSPITVTVPCIVQAMNHTVPAAGVPTAQVTFRLTGDPS